MKYIILFFAFIFLSLAGYGQNEAWTNRFNYSAQSRVNDIAIDAAGNVFAAGEFGPLCWGAACGSEPSGYYFHCYDSYGTLRWADTSRGTMDLYNHNVNNLSTFGTAVDHQGNFYIGGIYTGNCHLGSIILPTSQGTADGIVAKIDNNGNWLWARTFGLRFHIGNISVLPNQELVVTGNYSRDYNDSIDGQFISAGLHDFVAKLDNVGHIQWIKTLPNESVYRLAVHDTSIYVSSFSSIYKYDLTGNSITLAGGNCDFAVGTNGDIFVTGAYSFGSNSVYLAKKNSSGGNVWLVNLTGGGNITIQSDSMDNLFVRTYEGTMFDSVSAVKVYKYDSNGNHIWTYLINPTAGIEIQSDVTGDLYVYGYELDFNSGSGFPENDNARVTKICNADCAVVTSIAEITNNLNSTVFPNPTPGVFQLNFSSTYSDNAVVNVVDSHGQYIYTTKIQSSGEQFKLEIDLSKYAKGIYFIQVISGEGRQVQKIIVE